MVGFQHLTSVWNNWLPIRICIGWIVNEKNKNKNIDLHFRYRNGYIVVLHYEFQESYIVN